jgi:hypothetical protein
VFPVYDASWARKNWTICETPSGPGHHGFAAACAIITAEAAANYTRGKNRLLAEVLTEHLKEIWQPK